jgi:hypothetical protein
VFCAPGLMFGDTEGVWSCFHVLRARTQFSCFARSDLYSAVSGASGPILMFCTPGRVFGGTEGVVSRFHIL